MSDFKDLNELLSIARNINEGKYDILGADIDSESELYDIAKYFNDALKKLQTVSDEISPAYDDIPIFEQVLKNVINDSKSASLDVLSLVDKINFNIDEMKEYLSKVKEHHEMEDYNKTLGMLDKIHGKCVDGEDLCFDIVSSLEFKESNRSRVEESLSVLRSLEERISNILIKLGVKQNLIDPERLDKIKDSKEILQDQDLVDRLLKEFGV